MQFRQQPTQIDQAIGWSREHDHGNVELWKILLEGKISIDSHQHVELLLSQGKQFTVLDSRPARLRERDHLVPLDCPGEATVDTFVEKDPHQETARMRVFASSKTAMTCSRLTVGKPSRKSSIVCPPSKYSMRV
jgi:hypothetical protein